jgi:hypothetical protein
LETYLFFSIRALVGQSWSSLSTTALLPTDAGNNNSRQHFQSLVRRRDFLGWGNWEHLSVVTLDGADLGKNENETMVYRRIDWFAGYPFPAASSFSRNTTTKQGNAKKVDEQ